MKTALLVILSFTFYSADAQDSLLIKDVFDFNIGDVFEYQTDYRGGCTGTKIECDTLIDKTYSANLDTVFYKFLEYISDNRTVSPGCPALSMSNRIRIDKYHSLDSLLWYYDGYIKNTAMAPFLISGKDGCGSKLRGYAEIPINPGIESMGKVYGKGIGLVKYTDVWAHSYTYINLIYYHKSSIICNNGHITDVPQFSVINDDVSIYPNPATDHLSIRLLKATSGYSINIFDIMGRNVFYERNVLAELFDCNINHLNSGMFDLIIRTKEGTIYNKKFIKQ